MELLAKALFAVAEPLHHEGHPQFLFGKGEVTGQYAVTKIATFQ